MIDGNNKSNQLFSDMDVFCDNSLEVFIDENLSKKITLNQVTIE